MASLNAAHPYFVRCIKPNTQKLPDKFEHRTVLNQLRYSGMMETVRIRKAGYPVRREQQMFIERFFVLAKVVTSSSIKLPIEDPSDVIRQLLMEYDPDNKLWQIGISKVFMKEQLENKLEAERDLAYRAYINIIASYIYTFVLRKRFLKIRRAAVLIQTHIRFAVLYSLCIYNSCWYHSLYLDDRLLCVDSHRCVTLLSLYRSLLAGFWRVSCTWSCYEGRERKKKGRNGKKRRRRGGEEKNC